MSSDVGPKQVRRKTPNLLPPREYDRGPLEVVEKNKDGSRGDRDVVHDPDTKTAAANMKAIEDRLCAEMEANPMGPRSVLNEIDDKMQTVASLLSELRYTLGMRSATEVPHEREVVSRIAREVAYMSDMANNVMSILNK